MRILIISDAWHPQVNGVVTTYTEISKALSEEGHDIKIISPEDFLLKAAIPFYKEIKLSLPLSLSRKIKDFDPDRIHIATEGPLGRVARKYCLKHNIDFTSFYHTKFPEYAAVFIEEKLKLPRLKQWIEDRAYASLRAFHKQSTALFVTTKGMMNELRSKNFTAPMAIVTRGINQDFFHLGEKKLFQNLPQPVALYVGRVSHEKNLESFLKMSWEGTKVIVGDGPHKQELENKYPDTIFTGKKSGIELGDHYRSADVFVFPSLTDTFGLVMIEAMACGLPIAGYNVTGPKDIVTHEKLGTIGNDLSAAAHKAIKTGTPEERNNHAIENYGWELAAKQFTNMQYVTNSQKTLEK